MFFPAKGALHRLPLSRFVTEKETARSESASPVDRSMYKDKDKDDEETALPDKLDPSVHGISDDGGSRPPTDTAADNGLVESTRYYPTSVVKAPKATDRSRWCTCRPHRRRRQ